MSHFNCLGIDEGRQRLWRFDTTQNRCLWSLDLAELPLARDLQRLGPDRALVGFDRGFFEIGLASGRVLMVRDGWQKVSAACRLPDGSTLVTGLDLEGNRGVTVLTLDPEHRVAGAACRDGEYVRLMRPSGQGTYLFCLDDHILETRTDLSAIGEFRAPGFRHAWKAQRLPDGHTLVSAGYGAFLALFDAQGKLLRTIGAAGSVPAEVEPFFYASFQVLDDGRIVCANWQDHGPGNGHKGRQLLEFSPDGEFLGAWSNPDEISSLQGILVL